jgi:hypothetical protein
LAIPIDLRAAKALPKNWPQAAREQRNAGKGEGSFILFCRVKQRALCHLIGLDFLFLNIPIITAEKRTDYRCESWASSLSFFANTYS